MRGRLSVCSGANNAAANPRHDGDSPADADRSAKARSPRRPADAYAGIPSRTATATRLTSPSGSITFQARFINWSKRNRGQLQRTIMKNRITANTLANSTTTRSNRLGPGDHVVGRPVTCPRSASRRKTESRSKTPPRPCAGIRRSETTAASCRNIRCDSRRSAPARLGQVERQPGRLGKGRDQEHDEAQRLRERVPHAAFGLLADDRVQPQRAGRTARRPECPGPAEFRRRSTGRCDRSPPRKLYLLLLAQPPRITPYTAMLDRAKT